MCLLQPLNEGSHLPCIPSLTGSKARAKAKALGKAKAKPSIGKAKPQGKAKPEGQAKANAKGQAKAKPQEPSSSSGDPLGPKGGKGWANIQPGQPMGQLGAQCVKDHLKMLVATSPEKNKQLLDHYEGLRKYSDKLNFALQLKLDRTGSFMTATETHPTESADKHGFEDGWLEDSMVAHKLGLLMWTTDETHKERLADQLSTMEKRPHENPTLAAKGHMQYRWFRAKMREQDVIKKEKMELKAKAEMAVEDGKNFDSVVGQVMDTGDSNFKPNKVPKRLPKPPKDEDPDIDPKQKAKQEWVKAVKGVQKAINQDSQLFLNFMAKGKVMTKDPMSGVTPQLMANIKDCYGKVQAQSKVITELLLEGQEVEWEDFDIKEWDPKLSTIKAVLSTTKHTKDIGKGVIC